MTAVLEDGAHYGRILRDTSGVIGIQEAKDCTPEQLEIKEINAGMYCFDNELLFEGLDALTNDNAQHEYYITDLVKIFHDRGIATAAIAADREEMMGINDPLELAAAAKVISGRINAEHMRNGVQLCVPEQIFIGPDVKIGHDVIIEPNVILYGSTVVEPYVQIKSGSRLENAHIHAGAVIDASHIRNTEIQENEKIGPYASVGEE
jgi:bifunctional UDP-N-acetylglucosamine pyrophosphorylase/glucosamine-1-phosphate N-acetyltransferase